VLDALKKLMIESPFLALAVVFWVGAVSSLSSCTAVRLPIVLGYVGACGDSRRRSLLLTGLFLAGLVVSYVLVGSAVAFVSGSVNQLLHASKVIFWVSGATLIVAGVLISGMISPAVLPSRWQRAGIRFEQARPAGALLFGLLFGLLTMPACPLCGAGLIVLGGIVAAKSLSLYGLATFASFALGQAVPVVAVGVLTTVLRPGLIRRLRIRLCSAEQHIQLLCGNLLIVLGIYYVVVG
jgi:cytochrome c biogenesis protein CcdA